MDSLSYRQSKYKAIPIVKRHTVHTKKQQCETAVHTIVIVSTADSDEHEHAPLCSEFYKNIIDKAVHRITE